MLSRRTFLRGLLAAAAVPTLWEPVKTIILPPACGWDGWKGEAGWPGAMRIPSDYQVDYGPGKWNKIEFDMFVREKIDKDLHKAFVNPKPLLEFLTIKPTPHLVKGQGIIRVAGKLA